MPTVGRRYSSRFRTAKYSTLRTDCSVGNCPRCGSPFAAGRYARGLTTRDIQAHLREMYQVEVSPDLISRVTDGVLD